MFVLMPLAAYVIGAVPTGVLLARAHGADLRSSGSGNVGATNVARVLGRRWGLLCFALDCAKGFVPAFGCGLLLAPQAGQYDLQAAWLLAGCGAIAGHVFNFWLGFRGGKGVATALGVLLGTYPYFTLAGLVALVLWIAVTYVSRYVSLGSIAAAAAFVPLFVLFNLSSWMRFWPLMAFAIAIVVLIIVRHRGNIRRLLAGTENKVGWRK